MSQEQLIFSDCVAQFITDKEIQHLSPKTIKFYREELGYFGDFLEKKGINQKSVFSFNSVLLREWFADLGTHRNKGGVACSFRTIKCLFNWIDTEYEPDWKNPIKKVNISNNKIEPLPEIPLETVQALLNACGGKFEIRDTAIIKFLFDSGVRASELLALNIEDVDLNSGMVKVKHGKGNKMRIVWIGQKTIKAVSTMLKGREIAGSSPLFLNDENERIGFFGLRQIIKRLCVKAETKEWGLHSFRRAFAINMFRKGTDILTISRLLGHTSVEITKRYLNIGNEDLRQAHLRASPADMLN